jgi:hypothetical protein
MYEGTTNGQVKQDQQIFGQIIFTEPRDINRLKLNLHLYFRDYSEIPWAC